MAPEATAHKVWPGAYLLASYLSQPEVAVLVAGARVVELGAGSGVPGLAAWAAGAEVVLTDLEENLDIIERAVDANYARGSVRTAALDWCSPLPHALIPSSDRRWDIVLAADCVFWTRLFSPLLNTLSALTDPVPSAIGSLSATDGDGRDCLPLHECSVLTAPLVLVTVTRRVGRAETFAQLARDSGWELEQLRCEVSFPHTELWRLSRTTQ